MGKTGEIERTKSQRYTKSREPKVRIGKSHRTFYSLNFVFQAESLKCFAFQEKSKNPPESLSRTALPPDQSIQPDGAGLTRKIPGTA